MDDTARRPEPAHTREVAALVPAATNPPPSRPLFFRGPDDLPFPTVQEMLAIRMHQRAVDSAVERQAGVIAEAVASEIAHRTERSGVSDSAVLPPEDIIRLVGGRAALVREWLRNNVVPLRHPSGRKVYRWGDVVDAMRRAA